MARILLLTGHYPPPFNAGAVRAYYMVQALRSHGHYVAVVPLVHTRNREGFFGEKVVVVGSLVSREGEGVYRRPPLYLRVIDLAYKHLWVRGRLASVVEEFSPGVVVATLPPVEAPPLGLKICRRCGCMFVVDVQDLADDYRVMERPWLSPVIKLYFRRVYDAIRKAGLVLSTTEYMAKTLYERTGNRSIVVVPNGVDNSRFTACYEKRLTRLHEVVSGDAVRAMFLGDLNYRYNAEAVMAFVRAVEWLARQGFKVVFDVIGAGVFLDKVKDQVRRLGLEGRVVLHGYLPYEKIQDIMVLTHMGIVGRPAVENKWIVDTLRLTTTEYLSCGVPLLGFGPPNSYAEYFINKHRVGVYVGSNDPAELGRAAIKVFGMLRSRGEEFVKHCRSVAEQYDWLKVMEKFAVVLEEKTM